MISYKFEVTRLRRNHVSLAGFALDTPQPDQEVTYAFNARGRSEPLYCLLSGWILGKEIASDVALYWVPEIGSAERDEAVSLSWLDETVSSFRVRIPITLNRPDAVSVMQDLGRIKETRECACGFQVKVPLYASKGHIIAVVDNKEVDLFKLTVQSSLHVIRGHDDWLFLGGDTNQSVAQYTGKLALSFVSKLGWQYFLRHTSKLNIPFAFLVAPSKESVVPDAYPFAKIGTMPIDQILAILPPNYPLVYPLEELQSSRIRSYRKNDTHWGLYGAQLATEKLLTALNLERECGVFAEYQYKLVPVVGDLGNKLYPPQVSDEHALTESGYSKHVIYDNKLANFGRVLIITNANASLDATLLMFASSSGYSMLHYLYRVFKRIVFVHTAGALDKETIERIQPEYIVSQTNARFMIRAPKVNIDLAALISSKLQAEPPRSMETKKQDSADYMRTITLGEDANVQHMATYFHQLLHAKHSPT